MRDERIKELDVDTEFMRSKSLKITLPKFRTFEWSDEVSLRKMLRRWVAMKKREEARLAKIQSNIELLETKIKELTEKEKEENENQAN